MKIPDKIYATIKAALLSELNECRASAKRVQKAKLMPGSFKEAQQSLSDVMAATGLGGDF